MSIGDVVPQVTQIDAGQVYQVMLPVLTAVATAAASVVTALGVVAVQWVRRKLKLTDAEAKSIGLEIDSRNRAAIQAALTTAAGVALNKLGNQIQGKQIDVKNPIIAEAVDRVLVAVPDAVKYFGLDKKPQEIADRVISKISQIGVTSGPPAAPAEGH